jgi:sulfur carrier protein ThiS
MTKEAYIREFRHMAVKYGETLAAFDKAFKVACLMTENGLPDEQSLVHLRGSIIDAGQAASHALIDIIAKQEICLMREGLDARKKYQSWFAKCYDWLTEVLKATEKFQKTSRRFFCDDMMNFRKMVNGALEAQVILQERLEKELLKKKGGADGVDRA